MPTRRVYIACQLRDLLDTYSDEDLEVGMQLLDAGQRTRLIGCLGMAQSYAGDDLQARAELRRAEAANTDCQTPEVRYVHSSDQAVSGDGTA